MLANSNPIGVILSSFLFGALNSGSSVLQMQLGVSKYLVQVLQFLVVLILAAQVHVLLAARQAGRRRDAARPAALTANRAPRRRPEHADRHRLLRRSGSRRR